MHKEASEGFNFISDMLLLSSLTLKTFFNCCYSLCQMIANVFPAGI